MHALLWAEEAATELAAELREAFPQAVVREAGGSLLQAGFEIVPGQNLPHLAFSRQLLPNACPVEAASIRAWAEEAFRRILAEVPEDSPWLLHVAPHYGGSTPHRIGARAWHTQKNRGGAALAASHRTPEVAERTRPSTEAGIHRCQLVRASIVGLLRDKRRHLYRELRQKPEPFSPAHSLAQLLLTGPETGLISVTRAPLPFEQRHLICPFPKGAVPIVSDKSAPSRAFGKLVEAETRMGLAIQAGQTCVDLGASPGSWSYVALQRGAAVTAVDRAPLRQDIMTRQRLQFLRSDAFRFAPPRPVDWLLCDVVAPPEQTAGLLLQWLRRHWCRQFVVTMKMRDSSGFDTLSTLKRELPALTESYFLTRLCANKKEVCAFGYGIQNASEG